MSVNIGDSEYEPLGNGLYQNVGTGKIFRAKIRAIDNGYSFPNKADINDPHSVIISRFAYAIWGQEIPENLLDRIKRLKYASFQKKLSKLLDYESLELFNQRIDELSERKIAKIHNYHIRKKRQKNDSQAEET